MDRVSAALRLNGYPYRTFECQRRQLERMPWFKENPVPGQSFRFVPLLNPAGTDMTMTEALWAPFFLQTVYKGDWHTLEDRLYTYEHIPSYPESWMVDISKRECVNAQPKHLLEW